MRKFEIFSAGEFIRSSKELSIVNPFTGQAFAQTWLADEKILNQSLDAAVSSKQAMRNLPSYKKFEILSYISKRIHEERAEIAELLSMESGKPWRYAIAEVDRAAHTFLIAAEEAKRIPGELLNLDWTPLGKSKTGQVKYFPSGVVAGISPFNFPLNLAVHKIAPAIAAGCPIVLKPASKTPLSTLFLATIIAESSLPKGAVSILPMDRETGDKLVTDERCSVLSFTGSPSVGWEMKERVGKKKVILELGGNAAIIVTESAELKAAVAKSIIAGFAYSGQICIHAQRIFVHESIFDSFSELFIEGAKALRYGDPISDNTDISIMIDEENAIRVEEWVNEAVKAGAKILCGGNRKNSYYEPTVITNTKGDMKVSCEEVFGPVVLIEKYSTIEEAVKLVNDSRFGLQAGIFSNNLHESEYAFENIDTGAVLINEPPSLRFDQMPYGGIKDSGLGREGVKYAMLEMMEPRLKVY